MLGFVCCVLACEFSLTHSSVQVCQDAYKPGEAEQATATKGEGTDWREGGALYCVKYKCCVYTVCVQGTARRKRKVVHKTATDDKKLQVRLWGLKFHTQSGDNVPIMCDLIKGVY